MRGQKFESCHGAHLPELSYASALAGGPWDPYLPSARVRLDRTAGRRPCWRVFLQEHFCPGVLNLRMRLDLGTSISEGIFAIPHYLKATRSVSNVPGGTFEGAVHRNLTEVFLQEQSTGFEHIIYSASCELPFLFTRPPVVPTFEL